MVKPQVRHPDGHVCAVNVCKPASSTRSTGRVTDQPYPAGDTGGQRHIPLPYSGKIWWALNLAISAKTSYLLIRRVLNLAIRDLDP